LEEAPTDELCEGCLIVASALFAFMLLSLKVRLFRLKSFKRA